MICAAWLVQHLCGYEQYFAIARGTKGAEALDMSKLFDTNYHYLVPELASNITPKPDFSIFIEKASLCICVLELLRPWSGVLANFVFIEFGSHLCLQALCLWERCQHIGSRLEYAVCAAGEARPGYCRQGTCGAHPDWCAACRLCML